MGNRYIFPALFQGLVCVPRESYKVNCFESSNLRSLTFPSHGMQEFEMVHSHLQDLCFLQFRWSLTGKKNILLCCIRFYEAVVLISNKTFNNTHEELPASQKHWAPASWALTGCGWSGLCASSLWSMQEERRGMVRADQKNKRLRSKAIIHSPLFSSFGPESETRCQETWTLWLGCTMETEREEDEGDVGGWHWHKEKHGDFDSTAYCYYYPP